MKNQSFIVFVFLSLFGILKTNAQTSSDALKYAFIIPSGTARTVGAGNSISALGADFGTLSSNPAGLASFRRSEFTATPSFFIAKATSTLAKSTENYSDVEKLNQLTFSNLGLVFAYQPRRNNRWTTFNLGIGFNRQMNLGQEFYYAGTSKGSITDRFLERAQGNAVADFSPYEEGLAYEVGAIYPSSSNATRYFSDFDLQKDSLVYKTQSVKYTGGINEFAISLAGNYKEKIQFGGSIGVPFSSFSASKIYTEEDVTNKNPAFNKLEFTEKFSTSGIGINAKAGIIIKPTQKLRLGLAVHTPTAWSLSDSFRNSMTYQFVDKNVNQSLSAESDEWNFSYKLATPWKFNGSVGYLFNKNGFISAEVDYLNYASSNFNLTKGENNSDSNKTYEREVNGNIVSEFKPTLNFRVGGEYVVDIFRIRAGFGLLGSPYAGDTDFNNMYSLGLGLREKNFFLDLAFQHYGVNEGYIPYLTSSAPEQFVNNQHNNNNVLLTLGFKF